MSGEKRQQNHREREIYYPSNAEAGARMSQDLSAAEREVWDYQEWSERHERH